MLLTYFVAKHKILFWLLPLRFSISHNNSSLNTKLRNPLSITPHTMSGDEASTPSATPKPSATAADSPLKLKTAVEALSSIVPSLSRLTPASLPTSPDLYPQISALLRQPNSGAGDNNLCRWLYDTFQSGVGDLQLLVLRFIPIIAGVYLSRVADRKPQAGFEAVLLAVYAHETTSRAGKPVSITIPDLTQPSVYHEGSVKTSGKGTSTPNSAATEPETAVVSPALEPHGTVRSTRRARIVSVALELFYAKIGQMPVSSKIDFCEFCKMWAGQDGEMYKKFEEGGEKTEEEEEEEGKKEEEAVGSDVAVEKRVKVEGRVPLCWELLQPVMRILGHCLLGPNNNKEVELFEKANEACRSLFSRSMHDVNPKAILPMRSLMRLSKTVMPNNDNLDPTELPFSDVISL
ncbi:hypothetical protein VIGAN_03056400 [Vigna angularis var. angularis]|uniref:Hyccin n=2 Tax=Phaseolus angularis TaxID=3914 RepID=A0A0S3RK11_PHAAN|nr:uncharacterized protein LOC108337884 [Vigna angularis]BAT80935.1 hypothetical protein VIGAN_03056400 [Vigna angularis var. angularis]